jgi:hypothetical protein
MAGWISVRNAIMEVSIAVLFLVHAAPHADVLPVATLLRIIPSENSAIRGLAIVLPFQTVVVLAAFFRIAVMAL